MAITQILTKANDWKHEREFRVLYYGGSNVKLTLDDDILSEVIFGYRMQDSDQDEIKCLLKRRRNEPKLFKAEPKADAFGLDIVAMDY